MISDQSLLLSTIVLNDILVMLPLFLFITMSIMINKDESSM